MNRLMMLMAGAGLLAMVQPMVTVWARGVNPTVSDFHQNTAGGTAALSTCLNLDSSFRFGAPHLELMRCWAAA